MQVIVGTTAQSITGLDRAGRVIQNLGPGDLYVDTDAEATTTGGLKIAVGEAISLGAGSSETIISLVASAADTDVRVVRMGEKI